ncbi:MAG: undecaprenyl-diphosphate phosphatase [Pirellulales bacterium]
MSELFNIVVLGAVQGLTEFLPISSDGHLVLADALLTRLTGRANQDLHGQTIVLHAGTLLAVIFAYWHRLWRLLGADRRVIAPLVVGTLPAVAFGLFAHLAMKELLENVLLTGFGLLATGSLLIWGGRQPVGDVDYRDLGWRQALWIGTFQASAILPGVSRSGSTIASGLKVGLRRDAAATFSFLLSVPAVGGACLLEAIKLLRPGDASLGEPSLTAAQMAAGIGTSFLVGLFALWWLLRWLEHGRLHYFAYWCLPLGLGIVVWQLFAAY